MASREGSGGLGVQVGQSAWSGHGSSGFSSQAFLSAAQSESRWTAGNGAAGGAPAPNQRSAGCFNGCPLRSRISITPSESRPGKESHTRAAMDETTAVATELPANVFSGASGFQDFTTANAA